MYLLCVPVLWRQSIHQSLAVLLVLAVSYDNRVSIGKIRSMFLLLQTPRYINIKGSVCMTMIP